MIDKIYRLLIKLNVTIQLLDVKKFQDIKIIIKKCQQYAKATVAFKYVFQNIIKFA